MRDMFCELRSLHSPDVSRIDSFTPDNPADFGILIQAMIGPLNAPGEEAFNFIACSPKWLERQVDTRYRWGHGLLILRAFDSEVLEGAVQAICKAATGSNWQEIADKLRRFTEWEFDNYQPSADSA